MSISRVYRLSIGMFFTDGLENANRKFIYGEVKRIITHQTEKLAV